MFFNYSLLYSNSRIPEGRTDKIFKIYAKEREKIEKKIPSWEWVFIGYSFVSTSKIMIDISEEKSSFLNLRYSSDENLLGKAIKEIILRRKLLSKYNLKLSFPKKKFYRNISLPYTNYKFRVCITDEKVSPAQFLTHENTIIREFVQKLT